MNLINSSEYTELKTLSGIPAGESMYLISAFLFSFSANIDSFIIGISYGIKKMKIRPFQNLLIALITLCGTSAALFSGSKILAFGFFPCAGYLGNLILLALGLYYVMKFFVSFLKNHIRKKRSSTDRKNQVTICSGSAPSSVLSWKEALLLGISLSANNLGIGIGASIAGLALFPTAPVSFLLSMLFLSLGNHAGRSRVFEKAGQYADLFCGMLLVILGFCQ